jgi:hypothetical protein
MDIILTNVINNVVFVLHNDVFFTVCIYFLLNEYIFYTLTLIK